MLQLVTEGSLAEQLRSCLENMYSLRQLIPMDLNRSTYHLIDQVACFRTNPNLFNENAVEPVLFFRRGNGQLQAIPESEFGRIRNRLIDDPALARYFEGLVASARWVKITEVREIHPPLPATGSYGSSPSED